MPARYTEGRAARSKVGALGGGSCKRAALPLHRMLDWSLPYGLLKLTTAPVALRTTPTYEVTGSGTTLPSLQPRAILEAYCCPFLATMPTEREVT